MDPDPDLGGQLIMDPLDLDLDPEQWRSVITFVSLWRKK
jgi:hypothetical protein